MLRERPPVVWRWALAACAVLLYAVALSNQAYEATSPSSLSFHVLLRKGYSIGAFALIGFLAARSRVKGIRGWIPVAIAIALYSTAIEIGQYAEGVREGLLSNGIDIACGFVGGAIGALVERQTAAGR